MTVGDPEGTCSLSLQLCVLQCLSTFTAGEDCRQPKHPRLETEPIPKAGGEGVVAAFLLQRQSSTQATKNNLKTTFNSPPFLAP